MSRLASLRNESGAAAAEMALVTPLLVILLFGAMEAGNYFWNEHIVVKAVRDGARYAGRQPFTKFGCPSTIDSTVATAVKNVTRTGKTSGGTARIDGWTDAQIDVQVSYSEGCSVATTGGIYASKAGGAPRVTVSATVPYASLFGNVGFLTTGLNLQASAQAAVMGI